MRCDDIGEVLAGDRRRLGRRSTTPPAATSSSACAARPSSSSTASCCAPCGPCAPRCSSRPPGCWPRSSPTSRRPASATPSGRCLSGRRVAYLGGLAAATAAGAGAAIVLATRSRQGPPAARRLSAAVRLTVPAGRDARVSGSFPQRAVAQLAEHRSPKPEVGGSSPSCPAPCPFPQHAQVAHDGDEPRDQADAPAPRRAGRRRRAQGHPQGARRPPGPRRSGPRRASSSGRSGPSCARWPGRPAPRSSTTRSSCSSPSSCSPPPSPASTTASSKVRPLALRRMTDIDHDRHRRPTQPDEEPTDAVDARRADEADDAPRPTPPTTAEAAADGDAPEVERSTTTSSTRRSCRRPGREPVRPARPVVRGAHAVGLREEGQAEPRGPHLLHEHGGAHPRGRHPDGGRRRVQGRQEGRRPEEDVPRLPARALRPRRRLLVRHPQHARRHRLRRPRHQALAAAPQGRRDLPPGQGRGRGAAGQEGPAPPRVRAWARPSGSRKAPSPTSPARSSRSTRTSSRSRCSSTSSAGRPRSSSSSPRWRSSRRRS